MLNKLTTALKNPDLAGTLFVGVGMMLSSFFSYVLQLFLGRFLSIEDFGTFSALLSISYLIGVPSAVFGTSLIKQVSVLNASQDTHRLTSLFRKLVIFSLQIGFVIFVIMFLARNYISVHLNIFSVPVVILFAGVMSLSFLSTVPIAYLQGLLRYKAYSFVSTLGSFLRMLLPIVTVFAGYKLYGVFGGMISAALLTFLVAVPILKKNLTGTENPDLSSDYQKLLRFSFSVMFVNFGMMLLSNVDLILVKKYFDPLMAGYYAGTVTFGKILLFGAGAVSTIMFPQISSLYTKGATYAGKFKKFFGLQLLLITGGVIFFVIFPKLLTTLFFGERFGHSVEYLPLFAVFIGLYVMVNFMVMYFLAIEDTKVVFVLVPGVLVQFVLINVFHASLYSVIYANIGACMLCLALLAVYYLLQKKNRAQVE